MKQSILICVRVDGPLLFPDNETGKCGECGCLIQHRPRAPQNSILRCLQCALPMIEDEDEIAMMKQVIAHAKIRTNQM